MRHSRLVLLNVSAALAMVMIDQTVLGIVLPPLQRTFNLSPIELQWAVNAYLLALAGTLICGGWFGDRFGHFLGFRLGVGVFTLASLACALAPSGEFFIGARVFQGIGSALMQPSGTALVFAAFPEKTRPKALAVYVGIGLLFLAAGPIVGGVLVHLYSWHLVFLINVPIGVVAFAGASLLARETTEPHKPGGFDAASALFFMAGLLILVITIQSFGDDRLRVIEAAILLVLALFFFSLLYLRRNKVMNPLILFSLFNSRVFVGGCILLFCIPFALLGQVIFGSVFIQNVLGFPPLAAGLAMLPVVLSIIVMAQVGGYLLRRLSFRVLAVTGTLAMAAGFVAQAIVLEHRAFWQLMPGMLVMGCGLGLLVSTVTVKTLQNVEALHRARASALLQTCRQVGGVFGIACIGALVNWRQKSMISSAAELMEPERALRDQLQVLLYQVMSDQHANALRLHEKWPESIWVLKAISSRALSDGYFLGAAVMMVAAAFSFWAFAEARNITPALRKNKRP